MHSLCDGIIDKGYNGYKNLTQTLVYLHILSLGQKMLSLGHKNIVIHTLETLLVQVPFVYNTNICLYYNTTIYNTASVSIYKL